LVITRHETWGPVNKFLPSSGVPKNLIGRHPWPDAFQFAAGASIAGHGSRPPKSGSLFTRLHEIFGAPYATINLAKPALGNSNPAGVSKWRPSSAPP